MVEVENKYVMSNINTNILASTYGCGTYGSGTYENNACASTTAGGSTGSGSVLTNTGFDLLLVATLAVTIIFIALIVRFWKRPNKKPPAQESD